MKSGLPPSSHAFARRPVGLDIERGTLRESLGGLRNLAQLLHSLRVGSRPLSNMLPDARDACDPLRHAMSQILAAAQSALGESPATSSLQQYVAPRLGELEAALTEAAQRPLSVKMRLSLEERVTRLSQELDTARGLFDLLADSIAGSAMRLDVLELSRQSFSGPPSGGSWPRETLVATLSGDDSGLEVEVNPRATTALIALGVELVADPKDATRIPNIRVTPTESGCSIVVERRADGAGEDLMLLRRGVIPPTVPVVTAAARANGALLEFDPELGRFALAFSKVFSGRVAGEAG
ncbi:MAG: hypothetical protein EOO73_01200 [Myxococcales bacterium]|nr:MAG: hypothetical protein EOO73_01200 [Myxococcales bacterium]